MTYPKFELGEEVVREVDVPPLMVSSNIFMFKTS